LLSERTLTLVSRAQHLHELLRAARGGDHGIAISGDHRRNDWASGGEVRRVSPDQKNARFSPSRTHKASSAESILSHVIRQRGWSKRWKLGKLTGRQHLQLLEDVRQYGRQWMRHEAEAFFGRYGDVSGVATTHDVRNIMDAQSGIVDESGGLSIDGRGLADDLASFEQSEAILRSLASSILSPLKRWFDRSRQFVRELIFGATIALKGSELTAQEAEQAEQLAAIQARYLDGFEQEIRVNPPRELAEPSNLHIPGVKPPMSPAQIGARAELYATSAWQGAQKIVRASKRRTGNARWERRILGHPKTEHCTDCPPLAALGWQPVGTLPDIGESECGPLCLCHFEYSNDATAPTQKIPVAPKNGRPKGVGAPIEPPAQVEIIQPKPTTEEIDAEVKKWIAGKPSRLTVKSVKPRAPYKPDIGPDDEYEWSSEEARLEYEREYGK
jgi:hypothetical protein